MARTRTCTISKKIEGYLGGSIPLLDRLVELDTSIWKLQMLKGNEVKYSQEIFYKKRKIFGYSQRTISYQEVIIDDEMSDKIIALFEKEYEIQAKKCEDLISKLEG